MKHQPVFHNGPLSEMVAVGAVDASSVRLWVRVRRPGRVRIICRPESGAHPDIEAIATIAPDNSADNTCAVRLPVDLEKERLRPLSRYAFEVSDADDGRLIGAGRFETAPASVAETPSRFSIALMSCNQPFRENGKVGARSAGMLHAARRCLARHDAKYILMVGDQLYTDYPHSLSLFNPNYFKTIAPPGKTRIQDCSAAQVRRLFQARYRLFWNVAPWLTLHRDYPSYPILDDHDVVDNWGSDPAHRTAQWRAFGIGAESAYFDYQGSRVLEFPQGPAPSFHYAFAYGNTATFVMDLRSQRTAGDHGQLYSAEQFHDLEDFLQLHADKGVVFLVLSVPAVHLPKFIARVAARVTHSGEDFSDRWSSGSHVRDRDRLLKLIHAHQIRHPHQKFVLLSGDIHIGSAHRIQWSDGAPPFFQLISSGITHALGGFMQMAAKLLMILNRDLATRDNALKARIHFLKGRRGRIQNPYGGMNLGIIEVQTPDRATCPTLRYYLYGHHGAHPVCVFRSALF